MNLYLTAFAIRRLLAVGLAIGAAFVGHHVITNAQEDSINRSIDTANKTVQRSFQASRAAQPNFDPAKDLPRSSAYVKNKGDGTFEVKGGGTRVAVKGLPTAE